jgi:hypothetical protein
MPSLNVSIYVNQTGYLLKSFFGGVELTVKGKAVILLHLLPALDEAKWAQILNLIHASFFSIVDIDHINLLCVHVPAASPVVPALENRHRCGFLLK